MAQHFLLSAKARTLSLAKVLRLSEEEAYETFKQVRWAANDGDPICPRCGCVDVYSYQRTLSALLRSGSGMARGLQAGAERNAIPDRHQCGACTSGFAGVERILAEDGTINVVVKMPRPTTDPH